MLVKNNKNQIYLNGSTWKFDKSETEKPLLDGEKIFAFKDPINNVVCVRFSLKEG
jgi:hypothetical protein